MDTPASYFTDERAVYKLQSMLSSASPAENQVDVVRRWAFEIERDYFYRNAHADFSSVVDAVQRVSRDTVSLECLSLACSKVIDDALLVDGDSRVLADIIGSMVLRLRVNIWAESEAVQRQEVKYPADWREAWKEHFVHRFPMWLQRRFAPVKYKTVVMDVRVIYPTFRRKIQNHSCRLIVSKH